MLILVLCASFKPGYEIPKRTLFLPHDAAFHTTRRHDVKRRAMNRRRSRVIREPGDVHWTIFFDKKFPERSSPRSSLAISSPMHAGIPTPESELPSLHKYCLMNKRLTKANQPGIKYITIHTSNFFFFFALCVILGNLIILIVL
jgi:hypothetical protein